MTNDQKLYVWGEGVAFVDGEKAQELQEVGLNFGVKTIQDQKGDGGGNITEVLGAPIAGRVNIAAMNPALFAVLTGASNTVGTVKRIRKEELTKATNDLTLSETPITNTLEIIPFGASKSPLNQVASAPAIGEYSVSGVTVTLNASQTEAQFYCSYFYASGADGLTSKIGPTDLPSEFEMYVSMRAKDLFPGTKGDIIVYCAKCTRTSELALGASVSASAKPGFDFDVRIDTDDDFSVYWPAT
jgi:hypothetical protein